MHEIPTHDCLFLRTCLRGTSGLWSSICLSGCCRAVAELTIQHQTLFFPLFVHVAEASQSIHRLTQEYVGDKKVLPPGTCVAACCMKDPDHVLES